MVGTSSSCALSPEKVILVTTSNCLITVAVAPSTRSVIIQPLSGVEPWYRRVYPLLLVCETASHNASLRQSCHLGRLSCNGQVHFDDVQQR